MSSIKLTADSGGGTFEIKAPSSSGNTRVLTIPMILILNQQLQLWRYHHEFYKINS